MLVFVANHYYFPLNRTCLESKGIFEHCKTGYEKYCTACKNNYYLNTNDSTCLDNTREGSFYKCKNTGNVDFENTPIQGESQSGIVKIFVGFQFSGAAVNDSMARGTIIIGAFTANVQNYIATNHGSHHMGVFLFEKCRKGVAVYSWSVV